MKKHDILEKYLDYYSNYFALLKHTIYLNNPTVHMISFKLIYNNNILDK